MPNDAALQPNDASQVARVNPASLQHCGIRPRASSAQRFEHRAKHTELGARSTARRAPRARGRPRRARPKQALAIFARDELAQMWATCWPASQIWAISYPKLGEKLGKAPSFWAVAGQIGERIWAGRLVGLGDLLGWAGRRPVGMSLHMSAAQFCDAKSAGTLQLYRLAQHMPARRLQDAADTPRWSRYNCNGPALFASQNWAAPNYIIWAPRLGGRLDFIK